MYSKNSLRWAAGILLALGLNLSATAGVVLSGTRVIVRENQREASIPVSNPSNTPFVVQSWIDEGEGKNKTPFVVTPPLQRLDPGKENILRIMRVSGSLPTDRESLFWLNVKEIPEKANEENVLQIAVRTRIKLFYRPTSLPGNALEARQQLQWAVTTDKGHAAIKVANPTPYHITLNSMKVNGGQQEIKPQMVAPFGEMTLPLDAVKSPQEVQFNFTTINDYGGDTPEEMVRIPVADKPVALKAEVVQKPAAGDEKK
ncbi:MAG: molecular chaperone [Proteobacteria bacterium]|nr:molecular chaperone [Pseudomonadota bacterium]